MAFRLKTFKDFVSGVADDFSQPSHWKDTAIESTFFAAPAFQWIGDNAWGGELPDNQNMAETNALSFSSDDTKTLYNGAAALGITDFFTQLKQKYASGEPLTQEDSNQFLTAIQTLNQIGSGDTTIQAGVAQAYSLFTSTSLQDVASPDFLSTLLKTTKPFVQGTDTSSSDDYAAQVAQQQQLVLQDSQDKIRYNRLNYERDSIGTIMQILDPKVRTPFLISLLKQPHYAELFFPTDYAGGGAGQTAFDSSVGAPDKSTQAANNVWAKKYQDW